MADITRYTWFTHGLHEHPHGTYVEYKDHKKIVDDAVVQLDAQSEEIYRLKKELAQASERYVQLWTRSSYR